MEFLINAFYFVIRNVRNLQQSSERRCQRKTVRELLQFVGKPGKRMSEGNSPCSEV